MPDSDRRAMLALLSGAITGCTDNSNDSTPVTEEEPNEMTTDEAADVSISGDFDTLVGAHYYPWYGSDPTVHWDEGYWGEPQLGEYDSREESVIDQHITWALNHGINWFSVAWWGPDSYSGKTMERHLLEAADGTDMNVSVLYETAGRLGDVPLAVEDHHREQLVSDFEYFQENLFTSDSYLRIDGRPLVYIYVARALEGDVTGAFEAARDAIDDDPYIVADLGISPESVPGVYDAVGRYDVYTRADDWGEIFERNLSGYRAYHQAAQDAHFDFIPAVSPGFNKPPAPDLPVLERSPEEFRQFCREISPFVSEELRAVLITSFNEWHEGTVIEPGKDDEGDAYDTEYLEIVEEELQYTK